MINNTNIYNVTKEKRLLIVLKILYYLQENINSKTLPFFVEYEEEVNMSLCIVNKPREFNKDTMSKIKRLIKYCEEQIKGINEKIEEKLNNMIREKLKKISINNQISRYRLRQILNKDSIPEINKFKRELETISELDEPMPFQSTVTGKSRRPVIYETRRGGASAFDPKRTISPFTRARESLMRSNFINNLRNLTQENINRVHRNARRLYKNLITRYKQGVREAEYEYRRDLEESHNRNKPSLSEYEKEYIRLWNLREVLGRIL